MVKPRELPSQKEWAESRERGRGRATREEREAQVPPPPRSHPLPPRCSRSADCSLLNLAGLHSPGCSCYLRGPHTSGGPCPFPKRAPLLLRLHHHPSASGGFSSHCTWLPSFLFISKHPQSWINRIAFRKFPIQPVPDLRMESRHKYAN